MIAGLPGLGITSLFYLLLAVLMPLFELPRALKGRSNATRWGLIAEVVFLAVGVALMLAGEYWVIENTIVRWVRSDPSAAGLVKALTTVAPQLSIAPFVMLAVVIGSMYLMRLMQWLRESVRVTASQAALAVVLAVGPLLYSGPPGGAEAAPSAIAVYPPPGFDFAAAPDMIRAELETMDVFYQSYFDEMHGPTPDRAYGLALANQVLGIVRNDPTFIARAHSLFEMQRGASVDGKQRQLAEFGMRYTDSLLTGVYEKVGESAAVQPVSYVKDPGPTGPFTTIILGRSAIYVKRGAIVKTQVDRVTRDWAMARNPARVPWEFQIEDHVPWHEGEKSRELAELAGARIVPVWGMKAIRVGERWYAPDAAGAPRFEISPDKVRNYPSTIVVNDHSVIVNDTHGISAIAWDALDADLVVGCGDHKGKMDAAFYLAERGVNVYAPTDRLMGLLIGARTKGTIIGSAPIRKTADGAVIGNQAVSISVDEPIVVSTAEARYPLQYYDTPKRYFEALAAYANRPLKISAVEVTTYGQAMNVVEEARRLGAKVLGLRVKSKKEHDAVAAWLQEDSARRAILFHTAVYPDGYKLFFEFPRQTAFGDTRPVFE